MPQQLFTVQTWSGGHSRPDTPPQACKLEQGVLPGTQMPPPAATAPQTQSGLELLHRTNVLQLAAEQPGFEQMPPWQTKPAQQVVLVVQAPPGPVHPHEQSGWRVVPGEQSGTQLPLQVSVLGGHSHLQSVGLNTCPPLHTAETHAPLQTTLPDAHSHVQVLELNDWPGMVHAFETQALPQQTTPGVLGQQTTLVVPGVGHAHGMAPVSCTQCSQLLTHCPKALPPPGAILQVVRQKSSHWELTAGAPNAFFPKLRVASIAPARPPATRRSASRRDIPPANALASSSNGLSICSLNRSSTASSFHLTAFSDQLLATRERGSSIR